MIFSIFMSMTGGLFKVQNPEIATTIISLITLIVALYALTAWKKQHKIKILTSFLDELTDNVHEFTQLMNIPLQHLKLIEMLHEEYKYDTNFDSNIKNHSAILFIQAHGEEHHKMMRSSLSDCICSYAKISSLMVKGKVLCIREYSECLSSCNSLLQQYEILDLYCANLAIKNRNWENPKVVQNLDFMMRTNNILNKNLLDAKLKYNAFLEREYTYIFSKCKK